MCFQSSYCADKDEVPETPTNLSTIRSFGSGSTDRTASGSDSNSQTSLEPRTKFRKIRYPSFSKRSSILREFKFSELKSATKNFAITSKLGEGGFGAVYTGTIKNPRDPTKEINVAVKQLGKRGFQVNLSVFFSSNRVLHAIPDFLINLL